ncbi:hypothetical protein L208DRAFT_1400282, partial [Tricholoma matsutake]
MKLKTILRTWLSLCSSSSHHHCIIVAPSSTLIAGAHSSGVGGSMIWSPPSCCCPVPKKVCPYCGILLLSSPAHCPLLLPVSTH